MIHNPKGLTSRSMRKGKGYVNGSSEEDRLHLPYAGASDGNGSFRKHRLWTKHGLRKAGTPTIKA